MRIRHVGCAVGWRRAALGGAGPAIIGCLTVALGASSGYCTACAMILGPEMVPPGRKWSS